MSSDNNNSDNNSKSESSLTSNINSKLNSVISSINSALNTTSKSSNNLNTTQSNMIGNNVIEISPRMENFSIILGVSFGFILLILMFFFSKTFNVGRTVERLKIIERYQKITNYEYGNKTYGNKKLHEVCILSSFNSCVNNKQLGSYVSENVLKQIIKSGARFVEFNVFSSKFGIGGKPVISNGYKNGEWKLTINTVPFENVILTLYENAFSVLSEDGGSPNNNDPLFISLNLSTGYNIYCLDLMADIILDYFSERLLDAKYAFQFTNNLHEIKMRELQNKVVIFASKGYEGSKLEELVNGTWIDETIITSNNPNLMSTIENFKSTMKNKNNKSLNKNNKSLNKNNNIERKIHKELKKDNKKAFNKSKSNSQVSLNNIDDLDLENEINNTLSKSNKNNSITKLNSHLNKSNISSNDLNISNEKINHKTEKFIDTLNEIEEMFENNAENDNSEDTITDNDINLINRKSSNIIRITSQLFNKPEFNGDKIRAHNKRGLTIVVPNIEGDFFTDNHDPMTGISLGCQFICMNFQYINEAMDVYITKFEKKGIIPFNELNN